ncbi:MAG: Rid family detoxifying hydrolase [Patescibacteria group bacterium]
MSNTQAPPGNNRVFGPYSPVRKAGDLYFVSGQIGVDPATKTASADIAEQTHQVFANLKDVLTSVGLDLDRVVKTTIFLTDMADFAVVNEVYVGYFAEPRPARGTVAVKELPRVAGDIPIKIEIEAVASTATT